MVKTLLKTLLLLVLAPAAPAQGPIVAPGAKLEKLFDDFVFTEGVTSAPDGTIYLSDITFTHVAREKGVPVEAGHI
jgi:hypothetical protein